MDSSINTSSDTIGSMSVAVPSKTPMVVSGGSAMAVAVPSDMAVAVPSKTPGVHGGRKNRRSKKGKKHGGSGASDYALQVYGQGENQTAAQGQGNVIQMQQVRTGGQAKGGNVLNDIAVPAVLLYANHAYGKKIRGPFPGKKTFRRKGRKSSRRRSFRRRR